MLANAPGLPLRLSATYCRQQKCDSAFFSTAFTSFTLDPAQESGQPQSQMQAQEHTQQGQQQRQEPHHLALQRSAQQAQQGHGLPQPQRWQACGALLSGHADPSPHRRAPPAASQGASQSTVVYATHLSTHAPSQAGSISGAASVSCAPAQLASRRHKSPSPGGDTGALQTQQHRPDAAAPLRAAPSRLQADVPTAAAREKHRKVRARSNSRRVVCKAYSPCCRRLATCTAGGCNRCHAVIALPISVSSARTKSQISICGCQPD